MEWFLQLPQAATQLSLLLMFFPILRQVSCLHIRPHECHNTMGDLGTCMFVWECIKTEGMHLGTCADGFLFGSCCAHNDSKNYLVPLAATSDKTVHEKYSSTYATSKLTTPTYIVNSSTVPPQTMQTFSTTYTSPNSERKPPYFKPSSASNHFVSRPTAKPSTTSSYFISGPTAGPPAVSDHLTTRPTIISSTTSNHLIPRPTARPSTASNNLIPRPTSKPSTASNHLILRPTSKPSTSLNHLIPRPTGRPPTASNHLNTRPTSTPPSHGAPSTINQPQHPHVDSFSSSTTKFPTKIPNQRPTTNKYGYFSSSQSWLHTSSFHSLINSTNIPVKATTPRPSSVTYWTPKYPFTRPSWKPITSRPVSSTTPASKPILFTYSTSQNTTRPSFTPFTTKVPYVSYSTNYTPSAISSGMNFTAEVSTESWGNGIKNSLEPLKNMTQNLHATTTSLPFGFSSSTTSRPLVPMFTGNKPPESTTQNNWFYPVTQKSTVSPTIPGEEESVFFASSSVQEAFISLPSTTFPFTGLPKNLTTSLPFHPVTSITVKTTTPLPVTPCGIPTPHPQKKVVGGKNSAFGSWPWQVSVRRTSFFGFSSTHRCGGALISRQWVATAGHCVDDLLLSQIKIRVGEYDFASVQEPYGYVERGARKKVVHPKYNFFTYENDLALVQLEEAIDSVRHPHISPICLPPTEENLVGRNATVTGWGRLSEGGVLPSILQEVQVPIISNEKCKNMFLAAGRHEYIPDIFMCAGFEDGGRDSCQGDSGGPLQIQTDDGYWFLAGIISWGIGCAEPNMPGVCTRISKFKEWVVQQIS